MALDKQNKGIKTLFEIELDKPMEEWSQVGHNRWHPDIPAICSVNPGEAFRLECKDWTDGQIKNNDDPSDIRHVQLERVHVLSGPVHDIDCKIDGIGAMKLKSEFVKKA